METVAEPLTNTPLTARAAWKELELHFQQINKLHLRQLFADDSERGKRMTAEATGIYLDYSRNRITDRTLRILFQLAEESDLKQRIEAMFRGDTINRTENRAVLHVALRAPRGTSIFVDGHDVVPDVHDVLDKLAGFPNCVRNGTWKGHTGKRIRNYCQHRNRRLRPWAGYGETAAKCLATDFSSPPRPLIDQARAV